MKPLSDDEIADVLRGRGEAVPGALPRLAAEVKRLREGVRHMVVASGSWPWKLSPEQLEVACKLVDGCTKIADNLLAGREWNGKEAE
jgi:hypothetical protein